MSKTKKAVGTKFFKKGTQNQKILAKFWGTGKTFTMDTLREKNYLEDLWKAKKAPWRVWE